MSASIALTRQAAAHRMILAAVRMLSRGDDVIAVHVVAASALNMLRELIRGRGENYAQRAAAAGFFDEAQRLLSGSERRFPRFPELDAVVEEVAEAIKSGKVTSAAQLEISGFVAREHEMLRHITGPYNFLKHADRDADALLNETDLLGADAVVHAVAAFAMLFPDQPLSSEVETFLEQHVFDDEQ